MAAKDASISVLDIAIVNAQIHTLDKHNSVFEALGITGDRIVLVGSNHEVRALTDGRTSVIDAKGKAVLPGFIDAHTHFTHTRHSGPGLAMQHRVGNSSYSFAILSPETSFDQRRTQSQ